MAWNTSISYTSSSPVNTAFTNGVGNDLRVWGGNVDAGGFSLSNLGQIIPVGNLGIGAAAPAYPITLTKTAPGVVTVLAIQNLTGTGSGNGAGIVFRANDSTSALFYSACRIYGQFDSSSYIAGRLTIQTATGVDLFVDTLTCKNGMVGIGTINPTSKLQVVGIPVYANNAAAFAGGLTAGAMYRTGADPDPACFVH